jgi:hypothetical protein
VELGKAYIGKDPEIRSTQTAQYEAVNCAVREMTVEEKLDSLFSYHAPRFDQVPKYEAIREAAKYFAKVLVKNTPRSADQSAAIRHLREAVMTANAAIANDGLSI